MTVFIANNMEDYTSDAAHTDGIIFLHVTAEDAEALITLAEKYGKQTRKYFINEDVNATVPADVLSLYDDSEVDAIISKKEKNVGKAKPKKVWVHQGTKNKHINEDELTIFTNNGWKYGRAEKEKK